MFNILWDLLQESSISSHSKALGSHQNKIKHQQTVLSSHSNRIDNQDDKIDVLEDRLTDLEMKVARFQKLTEILMEFIGERLELDEDDVSEFMEDVTDIFKSEAKTSGDYVKCLFCHKQTLRFLKDCIHCHEINIRFKDPVDRFLKTGKFP